MANEDMEFEPIIRKTEAPSRADGREKKGFRVAKLTSRTIKSLKSTINEKKLDRAYRKYNEKYAKMRRALKEANDLRNSYENGEDVKQSQVVEAYDVVASYEKKLSKYAVKLLTDDIKTAVADKKPKPIRVPRILLGKLRPITRAILRASEKRKTKKLQKSLAKEMKSTTRDFIESSLEGALFKDTLNGVLREHVDADVVKGLAINKGADTFEEKIANLKRFISADGKTSLYGEDEIGVDKPGTNLPPAEPTASVEKITPKLDIEELTKGLATKKEELVEKKKDTVVEEKPAITIGGLTAGLDGANQKEEGKEGTKTVTELKPAGEIISPESVEELSDEDKIIISKRKREVESIISLGKNIDALERLMEDVKDEETKTYIQALIEQANSDIKGIIARSLKSGKIVTTEEPVVSPKEEVLEEKRIVEEPKVVVEAAVSKAKEEKPAAPEESVVSIKEEPVEEMRVVEVPDVVVEEAIPEVKEEKPTVTITNPDLGRVSQNGEPSTLIVTQSVLAEMQKRNETAKAKIASLTTEIENLKEQKALYEKYIEVASATIENERKADELFVTRNETATEVEQLANDAAKINRSVTKR